MAGKIRVHQLAKELGVRSKDVLATLSEQGEFVKSASTTLEAGVARRLRAAYADGTASERIRTPLTPGARVPTSGPLTSAQNARIRTEYRNAYRAGKPSALIKALDEKFFRLYGVSSETLEDVVARDKDLHPAEYAARRKPDTQDSSAPHRKSGTPTEHQTMEKSDTESVPKPPPSRQDLPAEADLRPRRRVAGLSSINATVDLNAVAGIILSNKETGISKRHLVDSLKTFDPRAANGYGYLAWQYARILHRLGSDATSRSAHDELAALARVVDVEKQLLSQMVHGSATVLDQPRLAKRMLENEFGDLLDSDEIGRSEADELRRVRVTTRFLRRALVLVIASPDLDGRLWEMLGRIRPPTRSELVEVTSAVTAAIDRLEDYISAIEILLAADEPSLGHFLHQARDELIAVRSGSYDFFSRFRDVGSPSSKSRRREIQGLSFAVLPEGEQLRSFLGNMRKSGFYRGHRVDVNRLAVLEDLEKHFGADACEWYEGSQSSKGVNNQYLVLVVRSAKSARDSAVAISPLAGQHATYVVRGECAKEHWASIFANPKLEARLGGARRLLFTTPDRDADQYSAMKEKVTALLECRAVDFTKRLVYEHRLARYQLI